MAHDELAEINGIKPKVFLRDGEEKEVSSMSSNSVYKVKRTFDHFYCTCPAWRNQSGSPVNARTCKHLKSLFGEKYEEARLKLKNPDGPPPKGATKKPVSRAKAKPALKRKKANDDDEDEDDVEPAKRARKAVSASKPASKGKGKAVNDEDDEGEDVDEADGEAPATSKLKPELLLANKWDIETGPDPAGWWISEKLDGVRTYYDGKQMISRLGNPFTPPKWFLEKLPKEVTLDGELFGGRGEFQSTVSIVKTVNSPHWHNITFQVFDIPSKGDSPFETRIDYLKTLFGPGGSHASDKVEIVAHEMATSRQHVLDKLKEIESLGGEGLMLRKPGSIYEGRRSATLLKIKTFYDAEAVVTGYVPGKGRHKGTTGALKCKMESGKTFSVGTGLSDKQRKNPPKVGAIITYRFQELTKDGVPRFPSYICEAIDKDKPKDAEIPEHRKAGAEPADA
ncbi:putative DNA ligase [Lyophyllum shimeji]|uniref:DNA ligase n=1 Tax=Lyophyllum shimeji TaxID=47721 RepID=A0A9P3PFK9_LYOSH|nr:putative DNA ligase [Lyophyllum shimeji]